MSVAHWLLLPAFVHVGWVLLLGMRMGRARTAAVRQGRVRLKDIALESSAWPEDIRKLSNSFNNQFQVPLFFYAILPLLLSLQLADAAQAVLAWCFVASRIVHSLLHTGRNDVVRRFYAFLAGFLIIAAMWAWFALRLYVIG